jgi:trehalose/maltose transport system substrate-binding protein
MEVAMKKISRILAILFVFFSGAADVSGVTLKITCRSKGKELELCKKTVDEWIKKTGNQHVVEIVTLPHSSNECFALCQQWLSAESFDIDILQMDCAWVGVLADYLADLKEFFQENDLDIDDYFTAIRLNIHSNERLIALPWYADCSIMYYRKDLLEKHDKPVPRTWEELYEIASYIQSEERKDEQKKNRFYGFAFQARAFECLTCNIIEVIDSFGGTVVKDGQSVINSQQCVDGVAFLVDCIKNISSPSVLNHNEEDSRGMFQSGNALFMRSWPYAWSLVNDSSTDISGKVGVMPIPPSKRGGKTSGVLGGWVLTVSKYSKHKKYAADLVRFLTSKEQQRQRSQYSYLPAFKSLYMDSFILKNNPFFGDLYISLQNAIARPSIAFGKNYTKASSEIFNTINTILADSLESNLLKTDIRRYLDRLNRKLDKMLKKTSAPVEEKKTEEGWFAKFYSKFKKFFGFDN